MLMLKFRKTEESTKSLDSMRDMHARTRVQAQIERLAAGNPVAAGPVGEGISALRTDYGPGYRVYFNKQGKNSAVLLAGDDKRTQASDIKMSLRLAGNLYVTLKMKKTNTTLYNVAEHLRTPEEMAAYLNACLEEADGDASFIAKALGDIARAKGMTQVARGSGLNREGLYKALSGNRHPTFNTVLKIVGALGLRLRVEAVISADPVLR